MALNYEIEREHGPDAARQFDSCRRFFAARVGPRVLSETQLAETVEPLLHALTFGESLLSISSRDVAFPWVYPSSVMIWYYANYNALRAMLLAFNSTSKEQHLPFANSFIGSGLPPTLPHPFNMVATWVEKETYEPKLPSFPGTPMYDLTRRFVPEPTHARGMLLQYLKGTAGYWVEYTKHGIVQRNPKVQDFRTARARQLRDERIMRQIGYLHCAYRYRGKTNYRDAIFLTYGATDVRFDGSFVQALAHSARFSFLMALAYVEKRVGEDKVAKLLEDLRDNLRGHGHMNGEEGYWRTLR